MYQYDFLRYRDHIGSQILTRLNELGGEGWDVAAVIDRDIIILRRLTSAPSDALPCDDCELESGCIVQPFTKECEEYRRG